MRAKTTTERTTHDLGAEIATRLLMLDYESFAPLFMPDGSARQATWTAEDGWVIVYTTERVDRGRWAGRFVTMAYKPVGSGARSGKAKEWRRVYARPFTKRRDARARAIDLYREHSPRWDARHAR